MSTFHVRAAVLALAGWLLAACDGAVPAADAQTDMSSNRPAYVSALGRIEPLNGILNISASSMPDAMSGGILVDLKVDTGDDVTAGDLLAITDTAAVLEARLAESRSLLALVRQQATASKSSADATCVRAGVLKREAERLSALLAQNLAAEDETDRASGAAEAAEADCVADRIAAEVAGANISVAEARVTRHQKELERAYIYAPVDGRVLAVNTREGERIDENGILELGRIDEMYAIAEVYEADVARLTIGQTAKVSSRALKSDLAGRIKRIRPLVRKQDQIGTDPAARKDARVVEVEVILDSPHEAAGYTNLQVDVRFEP